MSAIVVDTSIWVEYFKGKEFSLIDLALKDGSVYLPPLVISELLSFKLDTKQEKALVSFLGELPICQCDFEHWKKVGYLRMNLLSQGISISTPDAHIAQCALDMDSLFVSKDKIFFQIANKINLNILL